MSLRLFTRRDIWLLPTIYILFGLLLFLAQDRLIYLPDHTSTDECQTSGIVIDSEDGVRGYYLPAEDATSLVVVYHGNAGRACHRHFYTEPVHQAGHSLLLVEYPGYGETTTRPRSRDLIAYTYDVATYIESLDYQNTILLGESIGSGFASYHATHHQPAHLLIITPFARLSDRAQSAILIYPTRWLLRPDLDVATWAQNAPLVSIIVAGNDTVIPPHHAERLYKSLPSSSTNITTIPNVDHNDLYRSPIFRQQLLEYLQL